MVYSLCVRVPDSACFLSVPSWGLTDSTGTRLFHCIVVCSAAAAVIGVIGILDNALQPMAHATAKFNRSADSHLQMHAPAMEPQAVTHSDPRPNHGSRCRALCIGLGGGSLPNFLSHHFPGLLVDAVELDPLVVTAATDYMGFPRQRCLPVSPLLTPCMLHALSDSDVHAEFWSSMPSTAVLYICLFFIVLACMHPGKGARTSLAVKVTWYAAQAKHATASG